MMELWYSPWHNQIFYTHRRRVILPIWDWGPGHLYTWPAHFTYTHNIKRVNPRVWIKLDEEVV